MANLSELNKIKKLYGERFMKMCREYYHTILEKEGILSGILADTFGNNSKTLYDDIHNANLEEKLKEYIYMIFDNKLNRGNTQAEEMHIKNPYELLNEAGYDLFECKTEKDIQAFKKYYAEREELCTFRGGRLNSSVVFFAVKKNVNEIKRENFPNPIREDKYGTSVMSIQFTKHTPSTVSIKNRYNHIVPNPDATYGNDLDRIVPGLTQSFEYLLSERDIKLTVCKEKKFEIPGYTIANDGKYYKYNIEINGIYYCPGNVIIEYDQVTKLENPEKQILIDYFVLDMENKKMKTFDRDIRDSFVSDFKDIEKIEILKNKDNTKTILFKNKRINHEAKIVIDKSNQIIEYENDGLEYVRDEFLIYNNAMKNLKFSNLREVGSSFLCYNDVLENIEAPKLEWVGNKFLDYNNSIKNLNLPNLKQVGNDFFKHNNSIRNLELSNLKKVGNDFLWNNNVLENIELSNLESAGYSFLFGNNSIENLELLNLKEVGFFFLYNNKVLQSIEIPNLERVGKAFLYNNNSIENLEAPKLESIGSDFLCRNNSIKSLKTPKCPELEEKLKPIIEKNNEKNISEIPIMPKDIADLDKKNSITSSEIAEAKRIINSLEKDEKNDIRGE